MDLWGAGCVMFEITSLYPLFPGSNEVDQISRIHKVLGSPSPEVLGKFKAKGTTHIALDFPEQKGIGIPNLIPQASPEAVDLVVKMLRYDAAERITSREAMRHPYFREVRETEAKRADELGGAKQASSTDLNSPPKAAQKQPSLMGFLGDNDKGLPSLAGAVTSIGLQQPKISTHVRDGRVPKGWPPCV